MAYGIFKAERMSSTKDVALLVSMQKTAAVENGMVVTKGARATGEQELYVAGDVAANTNTVYLVDGVAVVQSEETTKGLDDYINAANVPFRARKPHTVGEIFSISETVVTCLADSGAGPAVAGNFVETPATGNKLVEKATALSSGVSFGAVILERYLDGTRAIPMLRCEVTKVL